MANWTRCPPPMPSISESPRTGPFTTQKPRTIWSSWALWVLRKSFLSSIRKSVSNSTASPKKCGCSVRPRRKAVPDSGSQWSPPTWAKNSMAVGFIRKPPFNFNLLLQSPPLPSTVPMILIMLIKGPTGFATVTKVMLRVPLPYPLLVPPLKPRIFLN